MKRIVIDSAPVWSCDNMDANAPITESGRVYLFGDNSSLVVWDGDRIDGELVFATWEQKKEFANKYRFKIFAGDNVRIARGRKMVGEIKTVAGCTDFFPTPYSPAIHYLVFTDGTKVNANHCDVVGVNYDEFEKNGKTYYFRYFADETNFKFVRGGRI